MLMQTSSVAFWLVKLVGAAYLIWLGIKVLRSRSFISFEPAKQQPLRTIFFSGFLSAALNPKPGLFVPSSPLHGAACWQFCWPC
jgi:threonine/homoserine/homoserine lactone efflux protein